jgi:CyaY protein
LAAGRDAGQNTHGQQQLDQGRGAVRRYTRLGFRLHFQILPTAMSDTPAADQLSDSDYHRIAHAVLAGVEAQIDRWLQDDVVDIDTARTGGLLELSFANGSKIVINTQPPLQELWLAARSGGYHFRCVGGRWLERAGRDFFDVLSEAATAQGGKPLRFNP